MDVQRNVGVDEQSAVGDAVLPSWCRARNPGKTRAIHTITRMSPSPRIATIHQLDQGRHVRSPT